MKRITLTKLASTCALALCLAVGAFHDRGSVVYADPDDTPSEVGLGPEEPIEAPDDNGSAGEVTNGSTDDQSSLYWKYRYIHNNTGKGDPEDPDEPGKSAHWVSLEVKQPPKVDEDGNEIPEKDWVEHRIHVGGVRKKTSTGKWVDVVPTEPADGKGSKVRIVLDDPWEHCQTLEIKIHVEFRKRKKTGPGKWEEWDDWEDDTSTAVKFNVVEMLDGGQNEIVQAVTGDEPSGNSSGQAGEQGSMDYVFDGLDPNFVAAQVGVNESGSFECPDLVFSESASWTMPTGNLRFVATAGASFSAPQGGLTLIARDAAGDDAVAAGDIVLGSATVTAGAIVVPVAYRNAAALLRVSIMVRGALLNIAAPGFGGGTTIRYGVGGAPAGGAPVRMPPLARVGGEPEGEVTRSSARIAVRITDGEEVGAGPREVGRFVHVARPHSSANHVGYIDALVIGETESGSIRKGMFEVTPLDNFAFMESEDTKLYVVNADSDTEVADAFEDAEIEITSTGAIRVNLGARLVTETPLKLIILNPKLNLGPGPFLKFQNARVAVGGEALRGGLHKSALLVEGMYGTTDDYDLLPPSALVASGMTAAAEVETE